MATGASDPDVSSASVTLTLQQILEEFDYLATVEHALCVEYLFIDCALVAPGQAFVLADFEMRLLRSVNETLRLAGRPPNLGRASHIRRDSAPPLALAPLTPAQLTGFLDREYAIASAVDERYVKLRPAVDPHATPALDPELLEQITRVVADGTQHSTWFATLRDALEGRRPDEYLRPVHDEPADELERTLLEISDQHYSLILQSLRTGFTHQDELWGPMRQLAINSMEGLRQVNGLLVERNLLPNFTLPPQA
jgi:hypothetical protein